MLLGLYRNKIIKNPADLVGYSEDLSWNACIAVQNVPIYKGVFDSRFYKTENPYDNTYVDDGYYSLEGIYLFIQNGVEILRGEC